MAEGNCVPQPDFPCRVNLDLMPDGTAFWMYALSGLAFLVFLYGVWEMVKVWRLGTAWKPGDWKVGLKRLVVGMATHRKFRQSPPEATKSGMLHAWVFFGFVVLFIGTVIVAIDADFFELVLDSKLLYGDHYLLYEAVLDAFGVVFLAGIALLAYRRYAKPPGHLHKTKPVDAPKWLPMAPDAFALLMLFVIGVTGFVLEAMRLRYQIETSGIRYAHWSFVGNALGLTMQGWSPERFLQVYPVVWYVHFLAWSATLAVLPWTKLKHILTSSLNLYFHDPRRQSLPQLPTPFNLQKVMESGSTDMPQVGYATIRDLTWKHRLSLDACTNCGRCEAQCPATAAGRPLSPRKLIQDLKAEMWRDYRDERAAMRNPQSGTATNVPHQVGAADAGSVTNVGPAHTPRQLAAVDGVGSALQEATLWSCTTCRACVTACPVDIEHVDIIAEMRRGLVMQSRLDEHQQRLLVNITNAGNPYGFPASDRPNWTQQLPPGVVVKTAAEKVAEHAALAGSSGAASASATTTDGSAASAATNAPAAPATSAAAADSAGSASRGLPEVPLVDRAGGAVSGAPDAAPPSGAPPGAAFEYLWWVGCSGSYDPRNQQVTRALATILNAAKVDFAILGAEERCNGDPARRLGEEGRFQQSVLENLAVLQQYNVTKVIAQCPHCFNTLRNEYPEFGAKLEVVHHTQLLEQLLAAGRIPLKGGKELKVTYHDSCYLMRHNGVADAPRNVIKKANNGLPVLEMAQNRETGLCCGAGGSNMWYEVKDEKTRINVIRAKQAADTGADTVATACPFCLTMMTDGLSLTGQEGKMMARDLAEIVADNLDWTPPAPPAPPPTEGPVQVASSGWSG